jgi:hypothetical protein
LAVKEGFFENEMDFNEIKLWATRKPAFGNYVTHHKKFKFAMGDVIEDVGMLGMGAPYELKATLKPNTIVDQEEPWMLTGKEWQDMCSYAQMLD